MTGHRFFNKTMSRIITFVIVTSCVVLPAFGALSKAGLRQIVTIGGKTACNTFCPAGFYDKPLYYYAENTHPAVIVFGNILIFLIINRKDISNEAMLLLLCFIGGFLFHILWEGKSRYVIPYIVILIPLASVQIDFSKKKIKKICQGNSISVEKQKSN